MKIIGLKVQNVKRIELIELKLTDENVVIVAGENGQGKSSLIDAIFLGLAGDKASKLIPKPIREGETEASVEIDLGEYVVKRTWTSNETSYLTVLSPDKLKYPSPQALLNKLISDITFDPLEFAFEKTDKQVDELLSLAKMETVANSLDAKYKKVYDDRALVNAQVKENKVFLSKLEEPKDINLPDEEINPKDILDQIKIANSLVEGKNILEREVTNANTDRKNAQLRINEISAEIKELEDKLQLKRIKQSEYRDIIASKELFVLDCNKKLTDLTEQILEANIPKFQKDLDAVTETNKKIRTRNQYSTLQNNIQDMMEKSDSYTEELGKVKEEKRSILSQILTDIPGLTIEDTGLHVNNIPLCQLSDSEKHKFSFLIGMKKNPKLSIMFSKHADKLGADSMKMIKQMAEEYKFQLWLEKRTDENATIIIEAGKIKE